MHKCKIYCPFPFYQTTLSHLCTVIQLLFSQIYFVINKGQNWFAIKMWIFKKIKNKTHFITA